MTDSKVERPSLVPLPKVAQITGRHEITLRRNFADGTIPAIKVGSRWYMNSAVLDRLLAGENVTTAATRH